MKKDKTGTYSRVIPIRWSEKSIKLFQVMGFFDGRDGKIKKISKTLNFNKFVNDVIFSSFVDGIKGFDKDKIIKRMKALSLQDLYDTRDLIEKQIEELALGKK